MRTSTKTLSKSMTTTNYTVDMGWLRAVYADGRDNSGLYIGCTSRTTTKITYAASMVSEESDGVPVTFYICGK